MEEKMKQSIQRMCIVILAVALLAGCGKEAGALSEAEPRQTQEDEIVLNVLAGQSTSDAGIEDMIDDFLAEEFPNVKLEWECVDWGRALIHSFGEGLPQEISPTF